MNIYQGSSLRKWHRHWWRGGTLWSAVPAVRHPRHHVGTLPILVSRGKHKIPGFFTQAVWNRFSRAYGGSSGCIMNAKPWYTPPLIQLCSSSASCGERHGRRRSFSIERWCQGEISNMDAPHNRVGLAKSLWREVAGVWKWPDCLNGQSRGFTNGKSTKLEGIYPFLSNP